MEIKETISKELKSMAKAENTKEEELQLKISKAEAAVRELDKALIANGLPPSVRGNKTGYSIVFTNKPLQESKKK